MSLLHLFPVGSVYSLGVSFVHPPNGAAASSSAACQGCWLAAHVLHWPLLLAREIAISLQLVQTHSLDSFFLTLR